MSNYAANVHQTTKWSILAATRVLESPSTFVRDAASVILDAADNAHPDYCVSEYQWIVNASDRDLANYAASLLGLPAAVSI